MRKYRRGLVVGKFSPLHCGHQYLLDEARKRCGQLVILSYSVPEFPGCGAEKRERWLRAMYPDACVVVLDDSRVEQWAAKNGWPDVGVPANDQCDEAHRLFVGWVLREMMGVAIDAVFTSEAYGDGFAEALGALQGGNQAVAHVEIDRERRRHPVSGTLVRSDIHANRHLVDPLVYADFVERIAILGGESTGKTTLARALAERLETVWIPEYGRELWVARSGKLVREDMVRIARVQVGRELEGTAKANRYLVCDTTPLTTLFYAEAMFGAVAPELVAMAGRFYDHTFFCADDFQFVQDGTRKNSSFRAGQQKWFVDQLQRRGVRMHRLEGKLKDRLNMAVKLLSKTGSG